MRARFLFLALLLTVVPLGTATPQKERAPASAEQVLYLIRSTLLTLNDANRTGNYSVLRDLAAPNFQARYTDADLARIFTDLRRRHFDLFAVALMAPKLSTPPYLDSNQMLRLTGFFSTSPLQINFDLIFQNVRGHWQLFGISVATPKAQLPQPKAKQSAPKRHTNALMPMPRPSAAPPASAPAFDVRSRRKSGH